MPSPESVRRRPSGVLVVGAVEPEVTPWLRAAGHAPRAVRDAASALADARGRARRPGDRRPRAGRARRGRRAAARCATALELSDPWLLAITVPAKGRGADAALDAGADDYLHRPFTRGELLARARAGVRAAQQRADDMLVRALMVNVPGAIYRSAWHAGHSLELISDEIERISGYPPVDFVASAKRTLISIVHPRDRKRVARAVAAAYEDHERSFVVEYRIVRADGQVRWVLDRGQLVPGPGGRLWMDGALFDITDRRAAEEALRRQEIDRARTEELRASRVRIVEAADAARRRIERDLHDGAQQRLVALGLDVRLARKKILTDPSTAGEQLDRIGHGARGGLGRAARARPRDPPGGADRAGPRGGGRGAGHPRAGAGGGPRGRRTSGSRPPSRRRPTSPSPRRSPTWPSTRRRATPRYGSRGSTASSWSRSPTTASAARTRPTARG